MRLPSGARGFESHRHRFKKVEAYAETFFAFRNGDGCHRKAEVYTEAFFVSTLHTQHHILQLYKIVYNFTVMLLVISIKQHCMDSQSF